MSERCYNMTWNSQASQMGQVYLGLGVPAFIFHVLFWIQVATHQTLRQLSMLWVYNYLFTDFLLLIQLFLESTLHTALPYCISSSVFYFFCTLEVYTTAYMTVLEAYMLVCLNITRYYLIVKNFNISARYPSLLIILNIFLYIFGISIYLLQIEVFKIMESHPHSHESCHFRIPDIKIKIGNLIIVLIIPIILNCYFMTLTTIHVRRSQRAARAQKSKHLQLLVQFFVLYILWLVLWAPNVVVSHIAWNSTPSSYTRFGSITSALCDPLIFMFIDRRFLKVWKKTFDRVVRCGRPPRQIRPTTISNELQLSTLAK